MSSSVLGNANVADLLPPVDDDLGGGASGGEGPTSFFSSPVDIGFVAESSFSICRSSFHRLGELYANVDSSGTIRLIDAVKGKLRKVVRTDTFVATELSYTHHEHCVLVGGSHNTEIRYLSLHDDRYLRNFRGTQGRLTGLSMSPLDDRFLSSGDDGVVNLWQLDWPAPQPMSTVKVPGRMALCAFDNSGLVFAVASLEDAGPVIYLYDARQYEAGPFTTFRFKPEDTVDMIKTSVHNIRARDTDSYGNAPWTDIKFSPDGNDILVATASPVFLVVDAFEGHIKHVLASAQSETRARRGCDWSPDSKLVLGGGTDGTIHIWNASSGRTENKLLGHSGLVGTVQCNPKYHCLASTCTDTALWISTQDQELRTNQE